MNPDVLKFASDKLISLILFGGAGFAYWLKLPTEYCVALTTAAGLAFQVHSSPRATDPQPKP